MRAMVMAAGLGTRLRPLTWDVPKPLVPVANRPVIEHILRLLARHGVEDVVSNLHWFPDTIRDHLGDGSDLGIRLTYEFEEELLDTAGGVHNVRDFLTAEGDGFVVMAGDALTDVDISALTEAHASHDGIATMTVKRVKDVSEYGVVVTGSDGRVQGFQEKPDPDEALSDLANCMIYAFDAEIFDHFPEDPRVDWAKDIFPALLDSDVPFYVHETKGYWNDVGSLPEYLQGNLDAVEGLVELEPLGEIVELGEEGSDEEAGAGPFAGSGRVLVGPDASIDRGARIDGPAVIGAGSTIGAEAMVKRSVLLPRTEVADGALLAASIAGRRGSLTGV
ncbi:NDP-sugar synthase [Thermoleophilia bacterium SCSIO 60948]|nr:NDP-sugar synthase [Thermoleophilia bacterium SCSIO 60948]